MGLSILRDVWRGIPIDPIYPKLHAVACYRLPGCFAVNPGVALF